MSLIRRRALRPNPPAPEQEDSIEPEGGPKPESAPNPIRAQRPENAQGLQSPQRTQNATGPEGVGSQGEKQAEGQSGRQTAGANQRGGIGQRDSEQGDSDQRDGDQLERAEKQLPVQSAPAQSAAGHSWPHVTVAPAAAAGGEYASTPWRVVAPSGQGNSLGKGNSFWGTLPNANRWAMRAAMLCLLAMAAQAGKAPLAHVLRPYTPAGKRDLCLNNLRALGTALQLYARDYDGHLPPPRSVASSAQSDLGSTNWVTLLKARQPGGSPNQFLCPAGPDPGESARSAYALNPVLAGKKLSDADDLTRTLLLADAGIDGNSSDIQNTKGQNDNGQSGNGQNSDDLYVDADDGAESPLALKPPLPGWQSAAQLQACASWPTSSPISSPPVLGRVAFRHRIRSGGLRHASEYSASLLYGDGHAAPLVANEGAEWMLEGAQGWGGSLAVRSAVDHLTARYWPEHNFIAALQRGDDREASQWLRTQGKFSQKQLVKGQPLRELADRLVDLWTLNGQMGAQGDSSSDAIDRMGWHLAKAFEGAGDTTVRQSLDQQLSRLVSSQWDTAQAVGVTEQNGLNGTPHSFLVQAPANWKKRDEVTASFWHTFWMSPVPSLYIQFEGGPISSYTAPGPIQWEAKERTARAHYGMTYRCVQKGFCSFAGNRASLWDFEFEQDGCARTRQIYVGYVSGWTSNTAVFSAPARDFERWRPLFMQALSSYRLG